MKNIFIVLVIWLLSSFNQLQAQADLLITPGRVLFDAAKQREEISLINIGKDTATYSISFVQRKMDENGTMVNITSPDPGHPFADQYVRIYPRQVTLAPGEPQVIVIQCRRQAGMAEGEYRSHLYFRSEKKGEKEEKVQSPNAVSGLNIQLIPIYGITIPVILRVGKGNVTASLSNIKLNYEQKAKPELELTINRNGDISTYGDLTVEYSPAFGKSFQIGKVKGIGVYTTTSKRTVAIPLDGKSEVPLSKGKVKVTYSNTENSLKTTTYAEGSITL